MKKSTRIGTAKDTLKIIEQGFYETSEGKRIDIRKVQDEAEAGTVFYNSESLSKLIDSQIVTPKYNTQFTVINETTVNAIRSLNTDNLLALNFASAKNPGGGFLGGAQAQEESIARATGLYPCLIKSWEYYETHRSLSSMLYTDNMIYSPNVPIFKDEDGENLPNLQTVSIITSAAVNAGVIKRQEQKNIEKIVPVMRIRMEKVLALAAHYEHTNLVLGAWGCGVFQNNPNEIAALFHEHLTGKYKGVFEKIIFAIKTGNNEMIAPFERLFSQQI